MDYKNAQCSRCKWWIRGADVVTPTGITRSEYGTCTESPPPAVVEVGANDRKRWKQPLMHEDAKCSRFTDSETGEEVDI